MTLRSAALDILSAAVRAADPEAAVRRAVHRRGRVLLIGRRRYDLRRIRRVVVVGAGKAAAPMAAALEDLLADRASVGLVVTQRGHALPLASIRVVEAGHPLPDAAGVQGARDVLALLHGLGRHDLVLCVLSGGGSALLCSPAQGLSLADKIAVTELLLRSGADIQAINTVRKHLSCVKGGQLAQAASPARVVALVLSDVPGAAEAVACGPASPDATTFEDALAVLRRFDLVERVPDAVRAHLKDGAGGKISDTPKPGDRTFERVQVVPVGDSGLAVSAAAACARSLGFTPLILSRALAGEARDQARALARVALSVRARRRPVRPPACILAGGETTVTVRGSGKGGRCQEFVLAAAVAVEGTPDLLFAAAGTDGTDGPTDAAGAWADGDTVQRARACGLDAARHLQHNDAYPLFCALGDLLVSGPTRTNVNDIYLALVHAGAGSGVRAPRIRQAGQIGRDAPALLFRVIAASAPQSAVPAQRDFGLKQVASP